jgi:hypothetical protein
LPFDEFGDGRDSQQALAVSAVDVGVDPPPEFRIALGLGAAAAFREPAGEDGGRGVNRPAGR